MNFHVPERPILVGDRAPALSGARFFMVGVGVQGSCEARPFPCLYSCEVFRGTNEPCGTLKYRNSLKRYWIWGETKNKRGTGDCHRLDSRREPDFRNEARKYMSGSRRESVFKASDYE